MAIPISQTDTTQDLTIPLTTQQHNKKLSNSLDRLETFLKLVGFFQNTFLSFTLSWVTFLLLGVALPVCMIKFSSCSGCEEYEMSGSEIEILVFLSLLACFSLVCISHNLRTYGLRRFLFVDRFHGQMAQFQEEYAKKINDFFRLLLIWVLPCMLLKATREAVRMLYAHPDSWWQAIAIVVALSISWTYSSLIYLSGCAMFNLVCNLQVVHFESYGKLLELDLDVSVYIEEHMRLTHYLSKISHRFRIFFILELLFATASLIVALVQTTGNGGVINIVNGGDFAISSVLELVGIVTCLHAAAKITHRAQGVASVATRWHSLVTCATSESSHLGANTNFIGSEAATSSGSLPVSYSESDLEAGDYVPVPTATQLASHMTSYNKRQAFVMYLLSNQGGFSVFGWRIDRILINTIFFLEMSLVLFVLGKTITQL